MENETLQTLITKYLDGEINPDENNLLQAHLNKNPEGRNLFEKMHQIHDESQNAVFNEILNRGRIFDEVFEDAWQRSSILSVNKSMPLYRWANFAAGLAAGLIISLAAYFVFSPRISSVTNPQVVNITNSGYSPRVMKITPSQLRTLPRRPVTHNVDWYLLTNEDGDKWLVEGRRDNIATPVIYHGDL